MSGKFKRGGGTGKGSTRTCLPVHCLSSRLDRQSTSHSLLQDDQIARDNRLPVECPCVAFGASSYYHPGRHVNVVNAGLLNGFKPARNDFRSDLSCLDLLTIMLFGGTQDGVSASYVVPHDSLHALRLWERVVV